MALVMVDYVILEQLCLNNMDKMFNKQLLIVAITAALLGTTGKILLAIIVALACLTTAIGLSSAAGQYFSQHLQMEN